MGEGVCRPPCGVGDGLLAVFRRGVGEGLSTLGAREITPLTQIPGAAAPERRL